MDSYKIVKLGPLTVVQGCGFKSGTPTWYIQDGNIQLVQTPEELEEFTDEERSAIVEIENKLHQLLKEGLL